MGMVGTVRMLRRENTPRQTGLDVEARQWHQPKEHGGDKNEASDILGKAESADLLAKRC